MTKNEQSELEVLREEIRDVDAGIADLVARRLELARRIGRWKEERGAPVRDYSVEKQVLERMRELAGEHDMDAGLLEEIALSLIRGAVRLQVAERAPRETAGGGLCCVVGGGGLMGRWLVRYAGSLGYRVRVVEQDDTIVGGVEGADLVLLATPLGTMRSVLEEMIAARPSGVVLEIASLKSHLLRTVREGIRGGLKLASIHPMFGPDTDLLSGQNLVVCTAGCAEAEDFAEGLFRDTAARIVRLPLEQHDRYMTWVLNLPHLVNLAMGEVLSSSGMPFDELRSLGGTTFNKQLKVTSEVMSENPELYYNIQRINDHRDELFEAFRRGLERIRLSAAAEGPAEFRALMEEWSEYSRDES